MNKFHSEQQLTENARSAIYSILPKSKRSSKNIVQILKDATYIGTHVLRKVYLNEAQELCFYVNAQHQVEKVFPMKSKRYESMIRMLRAGQQHKENNTTQKTIEDIQEVNLDFTMLWDKVDNLTKQGNNFKKELNRINEYKEYYQKQIRKYQGQINDILHVIELGEFNASQGYLLSKRLKDIRQERRVVLDKIESLEYFETFAENMNTLFKNHKEIEKTRSYRFREAKELKNFLNLNHNSIKESSKLNSEERLYE